jgi:hypothetical protein
MIWFSKTTSTSQTKTADPENAEEVESVGNEDEAESSDRKLALDTRKRHTHTRKAKNKDEACKAL